MEEKARRIVESAVELAEKGGFEAVRLREVASHAGVALGTLYRRFRSKEDLLLAAERPGRLSARNVLPARITGLEERDGNVWVHLHAGEPLVAKVTRGAARALALAEGGEVHVIVKAQAIRRLA